MVKNIANKILFPLRAVFMGTEGKFGLSSLREERMEFVVRFCKGMVLDIGCGPDNLFIKNFIGEKNGIGIDIFPYKGVENVIKDMTKLPFESSSFDTVTLIAVISHIPKPERKVEFAEFARVLKEGGSLILTEGEPISQFLIHKWEFFTSFLYGKKDMDTERGMDKDEEYCVPRKEILEYLNTPPLCFIKRIPFMCGLNNVYIAQKTEKQ